MKLLVIMNIQQKSILTSILLFSFLFSSSFIEKGYAERRGEGWATIENVWIEHNQYVNGQKGMIIHTHFNVHILKGVKISVAAFFFDSNEQPLRGYSGRYRTKDGIMCSGETVTLPYDDTEYEDFKLFMPYTEFNRHVTGSITEFKVGVAVGVNGGNGLAKSDYYEFSVYK